MSAFWKVLAMGATAAAAVVVAKEVIERNERGLDCSPMAVIKSIGRKIGVACGCDDCCCDDVCDDDFFDDFDEFEFDDDDDNDDALFDTTDMESDELTDNDGAAADSDSAPVAEEGSKAEDDATAEEKVEESTEKDAK